MNPSDKRSLSSWVSLAWQALALAAVLLVGWWLVRNAAANLSARNIASGFGFLQDTAGFAISEGVLPYDMEDAYWRAFLAGVANTLRAALPAVLLASLLGLLVGVAQISQHAVLSRVARLYVDVVRNVPLLVQVLLWYFALTELLPAQEQPAQWGGHLYLSKAGLSFAVPAFSGPVSWASLGWDVPQITAFGTSGGAVLTPEWLALVGALSLYGAAYCAEVVRAGLSAVPRGQWESGHALGLTWTQTLSRVILPQGLRVMVPPYTSLVMNTIKNSSLAVAVGYPDIVSVATTAMNQNGQAIECIAIIAGVYLVLNLLTALVMAWVNHRVQITER
ncbi:MAG: ABC transporter permease subunit [Rhodoferax sp.]|nr:ABC transporter permease subunit [Rhodoferax sp.]